MSNNLNAHKLYGSWFLKYSNNNKVQPLQTQLWDKWDRLNTDGIFDCVTELLLNVCKWYCGYMFFFKYIYPSIPEVFTGKIKWYWNLLKTLWLTQRVNCKVNYGLWVIITCQCRFISCKKCTTLVGDVDNWKGYACVGT